MTPMTSARFAAGSRTRRAVRCPSPGSPAAASAPRRGRGSRAGGAAARRARPGRRRARSGGPGAVRRSRCWRKSSVCQMSTQRMYCRLSSTSHSSPTCQPWFSPMMRRTTGAPSVRLFALARTRVITYCSESSRSVRWRSATSRSSASAAGVQRRLLARIPQHVALLADDEQRQDDVLHGHQPHVGHPREPRDHADPVQRVRARRSWPARGR